MDLEHLIPLIGRSNIEQDIIIRSRIQMWRNKVNLDKPNNVKC